MAVVKSTLKNMLKVTKEQYNTLINGGTITDGTETYTYDANAIYLIDDGINHDKIYLVDLYPSSDSNGIIINFGDINSNDPHGLAYAYIGEDDEDALLYHADSHTFEGTATFKNGIDVKNNLWLSNNSIYHKSFNQDIHNSLPSSSGVLALKSEIPTNLSQLTNDAGYITSISSSDVINALGYTPYDSSNPNGYITSSALNGYATQNWVNQQGYLTSVSWADITSKPTFATVATSGSYNDLSNKPTIPLQASDVNDYGNKYVNPKQVRDYQTIFGIAPTLLTNINGHSLSSVYNTEDVTIGGYPAVKIRNNDGNTNLTFDQSHNYMRKITGSNFTPTFDDGTVPQYSYIVGGDGTIYKPQWDSTNGLLLYKINRLAMYSNIPTNYVTTDTVQSITGNKTFNGTVCLTNNALQINSDNTPAYTGDDWDAYYYADKITIVNSDSQGESWNLRFPDKSQGDYTIATTADIPSKAKVWTNSNPTSDFAAQTITVSSLANYAYIVVLFKLAKTNDNYLYLKIPNTINYWGPFCMLDGTNIYFRNMKVISSTRLQFLAATYNGSTANNAMIPIEIWGTNNI